VLAGTGIAVTPVAGGWGQGVAAAAGSVVINELHYNPVDDNPAAEFIELFNPGSAADLSGWCIGGIGYCFPRGASIGAGAFLALGGGEYSGALSNSGEEIVLRDASGATVDAVEYDDHGEWPALADGEGHSLQRRDPAGPGGHPGNWESAPPTPWAPNAVSSRSGLLPTFTEVVHDVLPAAGAAIRVTAALGSGTRARLVYRIGLGPEQGVDMTVAGGVASATIPGQPAGTLVRYRLRAWNAVGNRVGDWPRQGAGSLYDGTTVARPAPSNLPTFEMFMPDDMYRTMIADTSLSGDDGYPVVIAFDGHVFDNARVRVKGQSSRFWTKKKLKVILAPGQELDSELFPEPINEWALHSNWSDRSFLRETLASEIMTAAGLKTIQAFPARLELNGGFYGLYTYSEQPDGTFRDRWGLDDSEMYEIGHGNVFGTLAAEDAGLSESAFRARYDQETFEYLGNGRLREFIRTINGLHGTAKRDWIYANIDVPTVVNAIAASIVIQHQDWSYKNFRLVFDERGRISIVQNDYDLSFGRRWHMSDLGGLDPNVYVGGAWEQPANPLFSTFFLDAELYSLVARRIRTVTEELFVPDAFAARIEQLAAEVRADALADRERWSTYRGPADPTAEARRIVDAFVAPHYQRILGTQVARGRVAAHPQPAVPDVRIEGVVYDGVEHIVVRNHSGDSVDLSGFVIPALDFVVTGGTVLLPGRSAVFVHEDAEQLAGAFPGHLLGGIFEASLGDLDDGFALRNRAGAVVARFDRVAPGRMTEIAGRPDASAFVSLIAADTMGAGYLQALACDAEPRGTSNVNADGPWQTRAGLALVRFDDAGSACIYNRTAMHVIADLQGYLAANAVDDVPDRRLLDTRSGARPASRGVVTVTGRPDSTAVLGLVATQTAGPGYLAVVPCDTRTVTTSNLNYDRAEATVSSLAVVRLDASGRACILTSAAAHVVVDLQAYLVDGQFDDVPDQRLLDTRSGARPGDRSLTVLTGRPDATALVSIVATDSTGPGYVQVLPCSATPGATSNLNVDRGGATVNTLTTVRFGSDGTVCLFARTATHLVADVQGYFASGAFDDVPDQRLFDSR